MSAPIEVGIAHFAAICGMSENEFMESFIQTMEKDSVNMVLKQESFADIQDWILHRECYGKNTFCLVFRLSLNRHFDTALYCLCSYNVSTQKIKLLNKNAGLMGMVPNNCMDKETFEINFCDLSMSLPHPRLGGIIEMLKEAGKNANQDK